MLLKTKVVEIVLPSPCNRTKHNVLVKFVRKVFVSSDVASMEQMEQLLPPRTPRATYVIRTDPRRFLGEGVGIKGVLGLNGLFDIAVFVN